VRAQAVASVSAGGSGGAWHGRRGVQCVSRVEGEYTGGVVVECGVPGRVEEGGKEYERQAVTRWW